MDLTHAGNWRIVGSISVRGDGPADLFECPLCFAVTLDPMDHAAYHQWTGTEHPYADRRAYQR